MRDSLNGFSRGRTRDRSHFQWPPDFSRDYAGNVGEGCRGTKASRGLMMEPLVDEQGRYSGQTATYSE